MVLGDQWLAMTFIFAIKRVCYKRLDPVHPLNHGSLGHLVVTSLKDNPPTLLVCPGVFKSNQILTIHSLPPLRLFAFTVRRHWWPI